MLGKKLGRSKDKKKDNRSHFFLNIVQFVIQMLANMQMILNELYELSIFFIFFLLFLIMFIFLIKYLNKKSFKEKYSTIKFLRQIFMTKKEECKYRKQL